MPPLYLSIYLRMSACLQAYASAKESEIRGVCSSNYQEFVDSIEEIVRMKADVAKLQRDIDRFQHELASATSSVLTIHDSLDACYRVQRNIDESIEKLQQCQRIVRLAFNCECVYLHTGRSLTDVVRCVYCTRRRGWRRRLTCTSSRTSSFTRSKCSKSCGPRSLVFGYDQNSVSNLVRFAFVC